MMDKIDILMLIMVPFTCIGSLYVGQRNTTTAFTVLILLIVALYIYTKRERRKE